VFQEWNNGTLVFLSVRFPRDLQKWSEKLKACDKEFSVFREPDQNNEVTALACYDDGRIFKTLKPS